MSSLTHLRVQEREQRVALSLPAGVRVEPDRVRYGLREVLFLQKQNFIFYNNMSVIDSSDPNWLEDHVLYLGYSALYTTETDIIHAYECTSAFLNYEACYRCCASCSTRGGSA